MFQTEVRTPIDPDVHNEKVDVEINSTLFKATLDQRKKMKKHCQTNEVWRTQVRVSNLA